MDFPTRQGLIKEDLLVLRAPLQKSNGHLTPRIPLTWNPTLRVWNRGRIQLSGNYSTCKIAIGFSEFYVLPAHGKRLLVLRC